jgi:hypothetical protein
MNPVGYKGPSRLYDYQVAWYGNLPVFYDFPNDFGV